ncbi:TPA: hypothetical protein N0F65_007779 [Lagenidium giganteum]|uniref:DNA helicase Pif1-like 2B domain-containing protein n=1 Tax=Lagenidium giganteum TaxID=4803 RepID=A0AAV2YPJ2_9STRA|nr:TPA: hypothetical protein N0F65_007779 [Lagenidium giganteum]
MLIRNLNAAQGLCNGTGLQVYRLSNNCIHVTLISDGNVLPFKLRRRQFPVQIAFAMIINKAQGQSVLHLEIYLPQPVFAHGQIHNVKVAVELINDGNAYTKNIVYAENSIHVFIRKRSTLKWVY